MLLLGGDWVFIGVNRFRLQTHQVLHRLSEGSRSESVLHLPTGSGKFAQHGQSEGSGSQG